MSDASAKQQAYSLWLNGKPAEQITLQDRGLQYGDGFFTTVSIVHKTLLNWSAHWRRIEQACQRLQMPLPDQAELHAQLYQALNYYLAAHQLNSCVLKICFTRGEGGVGYQMPKKSLPNTIFYLKPNPAHILAKSIKISAPLKVGLCQTRASLTSQAGIKTLNRLENVLARTEVAEQGFDEGVMLNHHDQVVCGTQSNLYIVKDGKLFTPKLKLSGVEGTTRYQLNQQLASAGWQIEEAEIGLRDLENADELFFTNAVRGVQPVEQFLNMHYQSRITEQIHDLWTDWQLQNAMPLSALVD